MNMEASGNELFDLICEAAEEIMQMPEEEYLSELRANGVNVEEDLAQAGQKAQRILDEFLQKRREKMQQEYETQVGIYTQGIAGLPETPEERRNCLQAMLGNQFYGSHLPPLTAQFRNTAELSDNDVEKMLRSFHYLKANPSSVEMAH